MAQDHASSPPVLRLDELRFGYRSDQPIITGCSAELSRGRICALVGPNAAGKSTLLRLMLGHLEPWSGSVILEPHANVYGLDATQRAAWMSYVPQWSHTAFAFTAEQVVAMGRHALSADDEAIESAIHENDLNQIRGRVFSQLSAGQKQRVVLARAMAQAARQGKVMLLDEPTSALDLRHVHHTMTTLVNLARSGLAVLVVVHDLNLTAQYADIVWLLDQGRLAAVGPWQTVLDPTVLEPVYGTQLRAVSLPGRSRPLFTVETPQMRTADA